MCKSVWLICWFWYFEKLGLDWVKGMEKIMKVIEGFVGMIGNILLICLKWVFEEMGCEIYVKVEFLNFGGLVKDRVVFLIIFDVE